jgi:hypothetical protein
LNDPTNADPNEEPAAPSSAQQPPARPLRTSSRWSQPNRPGQHTTTALVSDPMYPDVIAWVERHFVPKFRRTLGGEYRWCAWWWEHAEAISRLTSLWYSWEYMRLQGATGMGLWYRDHLDHQLPVLLGARGPFYQCSEREHIEPHLARIEPVQHKPAEEQEA